MKKIRKYILITILGIAAVMLLTATCIFMPVFSRLRQLKEQAESVIQAGDRSDFTKSRTSAVYDCNDEVLLTYSGEKDLYYVEINEIPQILRDAFIVMEDREFYSHFGVDVKAVIRAAVANYNADEIVQGASTITQQLARNMYLNQDVNWERKILEAFMAMELEDKYSHPVERIVIDTLYLTRDSIIYKTKYIKQIEYDTIEKVYNLDTDGTLDLFYKLVSE